jgi:Ion channel
MRWVGGRPPRVWALTYILLIPIAGFIFIALPAGSFYDSNLVREPSFKHDLVASAAMLTSIIQGQENDDTGERLPELSWSFNGNLVVLDRQTVYVPPESVSVDNPGTLTFAIAGYGRSGSTTSIDYFIETVALSNLLQYQVGSSPMYSKGVFFKGYTVSLVSAYGAEGESQPPLDILIPETNAGSALSSVSSILWVPYHSASAVGRLLTAGQGDPKGYPWLQFYVTMCYFSAVTITTLGFGDITPATPGARTLTGVLAVFGVVLVGLFLNAIAQKWGISPDKRDKKSLEKSAGSRNARKGDQVN